MHNSILSLTSIRPPGPSISPIYYCNSTTFISTTAKSIELITLYEKLVPLINFSVFYSITFHKKTTDMVVFFNLPFYLNVPQFNPPLPTLIIPIKTTNCLINRQPDFIHVCDTCSCKLACVV